MRVAYPQASPADAAGNIRVERGKAVIRISSATSGEPFAVTCKDWPANPDLLLAAIPLLRSAPDQEYDRSGDLRILALDRATLKARQEILLEGLMSDDAIRLADVAFDTARYDLSAGRRAFGVRISREGSSRANPLYETSLRLFEMHADGLEMVLDGLVVHRSGGEWDTTCKGEFRESTLTLSMGGALNRGYRDIIASESYESSRADLRHGDCQEKTVDKGRTAHTLKFDGRRYRIPQALRSLDGETLP